MLDTSSIFLEELIGSELEAIWRDPNFKEFCQRDFMSPAKLRLDSLLFVGLNPSVTETDSHIYYYDGHIGNHRYFSPFRRIAEALNLSWMHLDPLFYRETDSKGFDRIIKTETGRLFIRKQLAAFKLAWDKAQPRAIVVCNATTRELLKDPNWLGLSFTWDEQIGTYRVGSSPTSGCPVFFTSMLGGQRALDNGSFERLVWHLKFALRK